MIAYSQPDAVEKRDSIDDWHILPPLPAKPVRHAACEAEIKEWFTKDQINAYLLDLAMYMSRHPITTVAEKRPTLEQRFREEAEKWDRETAYLSSTPKMVLHDSYQKIMAMGPDVVPLLLRDLRENRRSWFWALRHLTQANPVLPEDQGNLDKMIAAWVAWGAREGRI